MRRAPLAAVLAIVAGLACASCGGSTPISQLSASQILARVATDVAHQANDSAIEVVVATPSTTLTQFEDPHGDVSGSMLTPEGTFEAVRAATGVLSLEFTSGYIEKTAPTSVRVDGAALRIAAAALTAKWWSGRSLDVDPSAERLATTSFVDTPRTDELDLFGALAGATVSVGSVTTFDHASVVPLTVHGDGDVLFVSDTSAPLPVGASVPLGGDSSPTIFTFQWALTSHADAPPFTTPTSASVCAVWRSAAGVAPPLLTTLAEPGTYAGC